MKDRQLLTTTDTRLLFRQARVRNTRIAIRKIEAWLTVETKLHFPGRIFTAEYHEKMIRLKFLKGELRELERDLTSYRNKERKNRAYVCK